MIWSKASTRCAERAILEQTLLPRKRPIIVTNEHELIIAVNEEWVAMCGFAPDEAFDQTPRILQGECTDRCVVQSFTTRIRTEGGARAVVLNYNKSHHMFRQEIVGWQCGDLLIVETVRQETVSQL